MGVPSKLRTLVAALAVGLFAQSSAAYEAVTEVPEDFRMPEPLALEEAVATLRTRPGLRVELVAAEPLVMDPIAFDWGPDGRLWVVEMADYPLGIGEAGLPGGRVRFLEDRDGDGRYDSATVFLEGLNFPTSVKAWRDGVLVVACPEILYAEDTNGDGRADRREVLYRGFREGNQQHRVNGLEWDFDGSLVVANGDSGGTVESLKTGETLELGSFDLRIDPETGAMELLTGRTQYGRVRDDFGHWFGNNNSRPFFHFALEQSVLQRNPHAIFPPGTRDLDGGPPDRRVYPLSREAHRFNDPHAENRITSACGLAVYRDRRIPGAYGDLFICEPVHNLVHRRTRSELGATFRAERTAGEEETEFLASSDYWFRPVYARTGPEGGLWIADMHRYVIEHPEWIPEVWQAVLDLRAGEDRGRIYRVVPENCDAPAVPAALEGLAALEGAALAAKLDTPNGTVRDAVHQRLLEQSARRPGLDGESGESLLSILESAEDPAVRLQALAAAAKLGSLSDDSLLELLEGDGDSTVKRGALACLLASGDGRELLLRLASLETGGDPWLERDLALALGGDESEAGGRRLASLALARSGDPVFAAAAMSSLVPHLPTLAPLAAAAPPERAAPLWPYLFETALGTGNHDVLAALLDAYPDDLDARFRCYATFLAAADRRRLALGGLRERGGAALAGALDRAAALATEARRLATDPAAAQGDRAAALALLGRDPALADEDAGTLLSLLAPTVPRAVQGAAAERILQIDGFDEALERWETLSPGTRSTLLAGALENRAGTEILLDALESERLAASGIDAASRERLLLYPNSGLRQRAKTLLAAADPDRAAVVAAYAPALELEGDPERGLAHFRTACAACHQIGDEGRPLGPDLASLADKSPGSLLEAILDPNRAVEDKYLLYEIELGDGGSLAGTIAAESGDSLTVQLLDGSARDLLRSEIAALRATDRSAMPDGLEAALDHQAIADLIALLRSI